MSSEAGSKGVANGEWQTVRRLGRAALLSAALPSEQTGHHNNPTLPIPGSARSLLLLPHQSPRTAFRNTLTTMSHTHTALIASLEHQAEADRATIKSLRGTVGALKADVAALTAQVRALQHKDALQGAIIQDLKGRASASQGSHAGSNRRSGQTSTLTSGQASGGASPKEGNKRRRLSLASACSGESSGAATPLPADWKELVLVSWL